MNDNNCATKVELTELANKLFMYTDGRQWQELLDEVFTDSVWFDMQSAGGGEPKNLKATEICAAWKEGLSQLDAVHHQAGHYLINIHDYGADIYGYAVALHLKQSATKGRTRTFVGSYDLKATETPNGWRLSQFKYNLKYIDGNVGLE